MPDLSGFAHPQDSGGPSHGRQQGPHLLAPAHLNAGEGHREKDNQCDAHPGLHFLEAANRVLLKTEHAVDPAVDSFDCRAPVVRSFPGSGSAAGRPTPGGPHGSLGARCAGPQEAPGDRSPQRAGPTDVATPGSHRAAATTRARRRACDPKAP